MKKVKYNGSTPALLPTLGIEVQPGDVIDVPDDFNNALFSEIPAAVENKKPTSNSNDTNKEATN